jgi:GH24 family phage-related lysozyme (muramidase)
LILSFFPQPSGLVTRAHVPGDLKTSTLLKKLNAGDPGAAAEFGKWVYGGGKRLDGLVKRLAAEKTLFLTKP